tara:strand:+ start:31 stop:135 length:105 start_codon:yes stop_codon:yes gene_type:complete
MAARKANAAQIMMRLSERVRCMAIGLLVAFIVTG